MTTAVVSIKGVDEAITVVSLRGRERLAEPSSWTLLIVTSAELQSDAVLGEAVGLSLVEGDSLRGLATVITHFERLTGGDLSSGEKRYRLRLLSPLGLMAWRQDCRVHRDQSVPDLVKALLQNSGVECDAGELTGTYDPVTHVTQYRETDYDFVRRLCEEDGLYFREDATIDGDSITSQVVLGDDITGAPECEIELPLIEPRGMLSADDQPFAAWEPELVRRTRPTSVVHHDYAPKNPAVAIEGKSDEAAPNETESVLIESPSVATGRIGDAVAEQSASSARAEVSLRSVRQDAVALRFKSNAVDLKVGQRVTIIAGSDTGNLGDEPHGAWFVWEIRHQYSPDVGYRLSVEARPADISHRLPRITPRPRIAGVQSAFITGGEGEEIHTDDGGHVHLRFPWDRSGVSDGTSSRPVRVMQPQLGGSMLIPRIGWEVWVMFEDEDPDRPIVLGRAFNGRHLPPVGLPENKTMTSITTSSTPDGGGFNGVRFEDGAGGQGISFNAAKSYGCNVGNNKSIFSKADHGQITAGAHATTIGGNRDEAAKGDFLEGVGSQSIMVGACRNVSTPAGIDNVTGARMMTCGVLLEKVGSAGKGLQELATAAPVALVGSKIPGKWGPAIFKAAAAGVKAGHAKGGASAGVEVAKELAAEIPIAGPFLSAGADVAEGAEIAPWQPGKGSWQADDKTWKAADRAANDKVNSAIGGLAGAGAAKPGAAGPGHRVEKVSAATAETVAGDYNISTPAASKWTTLGGSTWLIGGSHLIAAPKVSWLTAAVHSFTLGAFTHNGAEFVRESRGFTGTYGTYTANAATHIWKAGGVATISAGGTSFNVGALVLKCGASSVVFNGSGVTFKSPSVTFDGKTTGSKQPR